MNGEFPDKFQKCSTSTSTAAADVRRSIDIGKDLPWFFFQHSSQDMKKCNEVDFLPPFLPVFKPASTQGSQPSGILIFNQAEQWPYWQQVHCLYSARGLIVIRTHLVVASGKLVLQKMTLLAPDQLEKLVHEMLWRWQLSMSPWLLDQGIQPNHYTTR